MFYDSSAPDSSAPVDVQPAIDTATKVARTILQNVATVPKSQQKSTLKKILGRLDPTLYDRTQKLARQLKKQGQPANNAVLNALAQSFLNGAATELGAYGQLALGGSSPSASSRVSGLGGHGLGTVTAAVLSHDFSNVPVTTTTMAVVNSWPYIPVGQNEQVLQIGQVSNDGNLMSLPNPLTFPLGETTIPINSMPAEYGAMLAQVLDQSTTFFEPFLDNHQDAGSAFPGYTSCQKGTRFYWSTGVDLSKTPLGPFLPSIDGGHSVPMARELLQDPYPYGLDSATGNPCCTSPKGSSPCTFPDTTDNGDGTCGPGYTPGLPIFIYTYPGTTDVWGVFLIANDIKLDPHGDTYVPEAWKDKATTVGPPVTGRLASSSLAIRTRKLSTVPTVYTPPRPIPFVQIVPTSELDHYNNFVQTCRTYATEGCGFSLIGFLEDIGTMLTAIIRIAASVVEDVVNAVGGLVCDLVQQPGGGQALGKAAVTTGPYGAVAVGVGVAIAKAKGCSAPPPPIICPAGSVLDATTGQCAPDTTIALYLLLGAGVLGALFLANKKKKQKPHPGASHSTS